jgi:tRNA(Ile2) C34 agmatinyltransferase TiaS
LQWYARAYVIVPKAVRDKVPDPRKIDVSWARLADDSMRSAISDYQDAANAAKRAGVDAARSAASAIGQVAETVVRDVERLSAAATAPISAYGQSVRNTVLAVTAAAVVGYVLFARASSRA